MPKTNNIRRIHTILSIKSGDVWGIKSQVALNKLIGMTSKKPNPKLRRIQQIVGVSANGFWDIKSQEALKKEVDRIEGFSCTASSFADPADVEAFKKCKASGKTDTQCFAVGDNGIGQFGKITAQDIIPMVAVHGSAMIARWGSINAAAHRPVTVTVNGKTVEATVEDRISAPGRIDLNPAAAKALELTPPILVPCVWKWA